MTEPERWRGRAYGVVVESSTPVSGLLAEGNGVETRLVEWQAVPEGDLGADGHSEPLVDRRYPDGRPFMSIEHDPEVGYRIAAPGFGAHLVANDGSLIRSSLPEAGEVWQRLFFAQALPLAAALKGLALFHASAVVMDERAYAFVGLSGSGKTSIAAQLVGRGGARMLTDDVLALEPDGREIHAYAGPARISIERSELDGLGAEGRKRLGKPLDTPTEDGKVQLETTPETGPVPLGAVFLLSRSPSRAVAVKRDPENRTQALLAAAFLGYLMLPSRLALHLEVCAQIAASVPTFSVQIGERAAASEVAETVETLVEPIGARR